MTEEEAHLKEAQGWTVVEDAGAAGAGGRIA